MAKAHATWKVLPHGPIEKLSDRVWRVEGSLDNMPLKRVMTIVRAADNSLVVHNGVALEDSAMAEIDAWGKVSTIIVPNAFHRLDAKIFRDRYPEARVVCPAGARAKVAEVVPVSGSYEDVKADGVVELATLDGTKQREGVMIVRDADGVTLVFNDAVFNMPHLSGVTGFVLKNVTASTGGPKVSRIMKVFVISDKAAFRAHLERLAGLADVRRIVMSHHVTIETDPAGALRKVAASV